MATIQHHHSVPAGALVLSAGGARLLAAEIDRLRAEREAEPDPERRDALEARLTRLEALLGAATVVDDDGAGRVELGATVTFAHAGSGRTVRYVLVASPDGAGRGTVSVASPVGRAILGRAVGSLVDVELPGGRTLRMRILAAEPAGTAE